MNQGRNAVQSSSLRPSWGVVSMMGLLVLFVLVPFLFWHGTWFGRVLSDKEMTQYLADSQHPRKTQHALAQIAERILRTDPSVRRWYPQVLTLTSHPRPEVRALVAWVMAQDNQVGEFHEALARLLEDPEPAVRRNAALSLVRFGDARSRPELLAMLQPYKIKTTQSGILKQRLKPGDSVDAGTLLARIQSDNGPEWELRSPLPGQLQTWLFDEGIRTNTGDEVVVLAPVAEQVWEALRALYLVGQPEDLVFIERFAQGSSGMPEKLLQQARLTAQAIRKRNSRGELRKEEQDQ